MSDDFVHDEDWEASWVEASEWSPTIEEGTAAWIDGIYQIERTDPILGGEYGISNVQAHQLAKRTQYLLASFLANHKYDGNHSLTDANIADGAKIAESKFAWSTDSTSFNDQIEAQAASLKELEKAMLSSLYGDSTSVLALYEALRLSWEYSRSGLDFCLFTDQFTFESDSPNVPISRSVNQDDSIDVVLSTDEAVAGMLDGGTWVLVRPNEEDYTVVEVESVLEQDPDDGTYRVLLTEPLSFSISSSDNAYLTKSTWAIGELQAAIDEDSVFITRAIEVLQYYTQGRLVIAHYDADTTFSVYYKHELSDDWQELVQIEEATYNAQHGYYLSTWEVVGDAPVYLKIVAHGEDTVDHLAVYASLEDKETIFVRKPVGTAEWTITRYGALYDDAVDHLELQIRDGDATEYTTVTPYLYEIDTTPVSFSLEDYVTSTYGDLVSGTTYTWRARYVSQRGYTSSWSNPVTFTLED